MIITSVIAFREFLEAFIIAGVFLGISRKLKLKKELEIYIALILGIVISLILASFTYLLGDNARGILTEHNADILQGFLLIFSGIFIAFMAFSLHDLFRNNRNATIYKNQDKLHRNIFDFSLFATVIFLVIREGFEIALFTATASLFSEFLHNFFGLMFGFTFASIFGYMTYFAFIHFPAGKVFQITEYLIILLGASMVQNGITNIINIYFNIRLSNILPLQMKFLPDSENHIIGHLVKNLFGVDNEFSGIRLAIMVVYIAIIYALFMRKKKTY